MAEGRIYMTINEHKRLDINNIPTDLFKKDKYQSVTTCIDGEHFDVKYRYIPIDGKTISLAMEGHVIMYRLKPLKSIRIDKEAARVLVHDDLYVVDTSLDNTNFWNGRAIEIIGDDE